MDDKSVKKNMKDLREKENLSQLEAAERLGMSLRSYNSLETGKTRIFNKNMKKFAEIMGSRLEDVMFGPLYGKEPSSGQEEFLRFKEMHMNSVRSYEQKLTDARNMLLDKDNRISALEDSLKDKEKLIKLLEKHPDNG